MGRIRITDPVIRASVAKAIVFERLGRDCRRRMGEFPERERLYWSSVGAVIRMGEQLQQAGARGPAAQSA